MLNGIDRDYAEQSDASWWDTYWTFVVGGNGTTAPPPPPPPFHRVQVKFVLLTNH